MKSIAVLCVISVFLVFEGVSAVGFAQSYAVQGKMICKGTPNEGAKVKLYDKGVVWDTNMGETTTNYDGEFQLSGTTTEITNIDPKINIYHKCDWSGPCYRKFTMDLPKEYITQGETPTKVYDIGTLNLQNKFHGESKDCIN